MVCFCFIKKGGVMGNKLKGGNAGARSPVAKNAYKFNRSIVFADKKRYRRAGKHKGSEPFASLLPILLIGGKLAKGFVV